MKRLAYILVAVSLMIWLVGIVGCGSEQITIPQSVLEEIYALTQDESVNRYTEIKAVEQESGSCKVQIDIKYDPEVCATLDDAFVQAKAFTGAIAQDTVRILSRYDINEHVSVWTHLPLGEGEVALLGNTWYDANLKSYEFKRYKGS